MKHTGHHKLLSNGIEVSWKPLLWFIKGKRRAKGCDKTISDFIESKPPNKDLHEWAQSPVEARHVIDACTVENQIVADFFMGSGTTGIAALKLNRKFIGFEINEHKV